jgi:hypothetical protein
VNLKIDAPMSFVQNQTARKMLGSLEEESVALSALNAKMKLVEGCCVTLMMMECADQATPKERTAPLMCHLQKEQKQKSH